MIPSLQFHAATHDIDKSGWWILIGLTIIGIIPLIIWWAREAKDEDNRFGVAPNSESSNKNNLEEKVKSKKIEVKNIQNSHNINTALQRERQKYKVRTFYLLGFIGCISIFIYFFTTFKWHENNYFT